MAKKRKDTRKKGVWRGKKTAVVLTKVDGGYRDIGGRFYTKSDVKKLRETAPVRIDGKYTGGREEGQKNLTKVDGGVVNQHGVTFTNEEKRALENAVNTANRKRKKMLEEEAALPRLVGGKDTGDTVGTLQLMGKESDFIISKKSKSLQRFQSKEDYNRYMKNLAHINSPDYLDERTRLYKRNHIKALENTFGDDAKDVIMKIRMMNPAEYRKLLQSDEMLEVSFVYDPSDAAGKLNQIRASLGMKLKEQPM